MLQPSDGGALEQQAADAEEQVLGARNGELASAPPGGATQVDPLRHRQRGDERDRAGHHRSQHAHQRLPLLPEQVTTDRPTALF